MLLSVAGHDPSSGAGITADLATFAAHGCFGISAITALTVQSTLGVASVHSVEPDVLSQMLHYLAEDLPPVGVKIGMLGSAANAQAITDFLSFGGIRQGTPILLDPVLRASSGADLLPASDVALLHQCLLPVVNWLTPNWAELSALAEANPITTPAEAEATAHLLGARYPHLYLVVTGGDSHPPTDILRLPTGEVHHFPGQHIDTTATHGTGCAFSSALLARQVLGDDPVTAVAAAKEFVAEAMRRAPGLGHGKGPLGLLWPLQKA